MSNDALKLLTMAVDRLKDYEETSFYDNAIEALTAQQAQESVAHQAWCASLTQQLLSNPPQPAPCNCAPLAEQREWVGLTDEEVGALTVFNGLHHVEVPVLADFIRTIEAKLKEKNHV